MAGEYMLMYESDGMNDDDCCISQDVETDDDICS